MCIRQAKGSNKFSDRLNAFKALALASLPSLDDTSSGDRCFWRLALAYLHAMNKCENSRSFNAPEQASIDHGLDHDVVILARALDTIGSAYVSLNTDSNIVHPHKRSITSLVACSLDQSDTSFKKPTC